MRYPLIIFLLFFCTTVFAQQGVRIEVVSLPPKHPAGSDLFVAGSFNNWNPGDEHYKFHKNGDGNYEIELKLAPGNYEYKVTRGSWQKGESGANGIPVENRRLALPAAPADLTITEKISIQAWSDEFPSKPRGSTANRHVHILDTAFFMPQLNRYRKVWIYLPEDYQRRSYPVLYMHDGQNVFDDATSYAGE